MEKKGTVYFFTGLAGAGKTTIGGLFYERLKARSPETVLLDGDQIRGGPGERRGLLQYLDVLRHPPVEPGEY